MADSLRLASAIIGLVSVSIGLATAIIKHRKP